MRKYRISVGQSRSDLNWKSRDVSWGQLCSFLEKTKRTGETVQTYKGLDKVEKGRIKDHGGFVGGEVDGARKASTIRSRSLVTIDIDLGGSDTEATVREMLDGTAWCMYTTHSHTPEAPRWRLIVPLSRDISPDEYIPVARKVAAYIGIDSVDPASFRPSQLMYWPTTPADGEYRHVVAEGDALDADEILSSYGDWRDASQWPLSSAEAKPAVNAGKKQEDPCTKKGAVGAFCRAYGIAEAIEAFLPDRYEATAHEGRYTYLGGSTAGGVVVYEDKWAYSHHGTDPCSGILCNAFDLVRIHLFGSEDETAKPDTPVNRLPSFTRMTEFVDRDPRARAESLREACEAFKDVDFDDPDNAWMAGLKRRKDQSIETSAENVVLICRNDAALKDTVRYDTMHDRLAIVRRLPWQSNWEEHSEWTDVDDNGLLHYLSARYQLAGKQVILDAHDLVMHDHEYHPIREYFKTLPVWDGVRRVDTLFVDYLGAEDTPLTRAVTRKQLVAAVRRVMQPGCKYDYVLTLTGPEGIGKSTILQRLGGPWFNDSFNSGDIGDKAAMEQLRGTWICELGELSAYKKNVIDQFKAFISKTADEYRPAYGRKKVSVPRQCVFFATTNETYFLKGDTGNRRFWIISVGAGIPSKDVFSISKDDIAQIWAEALQYHKEGETLFLPAELENQARESQREFNEIAGDDRQGIIEAFLRRKLPDNWEDLTPQQRARWFKDGAMPIGAEDCTYVRKYICAGEVANECFGREMNRFEKKEINQILNRIEGLEQAGNIRISDRAYGGQRRYRIAPEFYATMACNNECNNEFMQQ